MQDNFNFITFKEVTGISSIDEEAYSFILRAVFDNIKALYLIDIDKMISVPNDLSFAIYSHAKVLFESVKNNVSLVESLGDSSGNRTKFSPRLPKEIITVYRIYANTPPAFV